MIELEQPPPLPFQLGNPEGYLTYALNELYPLMTQEEVERLVVLSPSGTNLNKTSGRLLPILKHFLHHREFTFPLLPSEAYILYWILQPASMGRTSTSEPIIHMAFDRFSLSERIMAPSVTIQSVQRTVYKMCVGSLTRYLTSTHDTIKNKKTRHRLITAHNSPQFKVMHLSGLTEMQEQAFYLSTFKDPIKNRYLNRSQILNRLQALGSPITGNSLNGVWKEAVEILNNPSFIEGVYQRLVKILKEKKAPFELTSERIAIAEFVITKIENGIPIADSRRSLSNKNILNLIKDSPDIKIKITKRQVEYFLGTLVPRINLD